MNLNKLLKIVTVVFFLGFLFTIPTITFFTVDKRVSEIENKILTQKPKITLRAIKNKSFMDDFSSYVSDQFPNRVNFIKLKNSTSYLLGNREFRNIYLTKENTLLEKFTLNKTIINTNLDNIYKQTETLFSNYGINSTLIIVPTAIGLYNELLPSWAITDNQESTLKYINKYIDTLSQNNEKLLSFYTPYNILSKYKDQQIYFNTDHHWTQLGARIAYEDFKENEIDINSLTSNKYSLAANNFYGSFYSKAILNKIKPDNIYSYNEFNNNSIYVDFSKTYSTLYDTNLLRGKNKYQYFLHGDPGYALVDGKGKGEILIFKDSYAHSFIPFLTQDYSKIHVVDPRYYNFDIFEFLKDNPNISKVLYLFNLQTFNSTVF